KSKAGQTGNEWRIERRAPQHCRYVSGHQATPAQHGALEVIGIIPLGWMPVDGEPHRGHAHENEPHGADDCPLPSPGPNGSHRWAIKRSDDPTGNRSRGTRWRSAAKHEASSALIAAGGRLRS